ncbi:MAG: hypothetical protein K5909_05250 [Bacteroidales bacterium]|nr:hypothetical protein [Bacteroidales bacterium]
MEKSVKEVFNEIQTTIDALRAQLDELEDRLQVMVAEIPDQVGDDLAEEPAKPEPEPVEVEPEPVVVPEPMAEPEPEPTVEPEPVSEPEPVAVELEAEIEPEPVELEAEPAPAEEPAPAVEPEPEIIDLSIDMAGMGARTVPDARNYQWMIDLPGGPIANVISAISLNDRVLFINTLFKEDPSLFQQTISAFNGMESISEAVSYVIANFPDWNLNSEVVYRLMMAVRRKLK